MRSRMLWICFLMASSLGLSLPGWASKSDDQSPSLPCNGALSSPSGDRYFVGAGGRLKDFSLKVKPKFTQAELEQARAELTPKNPKYKLGETGNFVIYVESRMIPGFVEPQIVAVKYEKDNRTNEEKQLSQQMDLIFGGSRPTESQQIVEALHNQHAIFKELGLLKYFDVLLPLDSGSDFIVMPIVYGESLDQMTFNALEAYKLPDRNRQDHVGSLGPVPIEVDAHLAKVWRAQQFGMQKVLKALIANGYNVQRKYSLRAWPSDQKFLYCVLLKRGAEPQLTLNTDLMISIDGRLVVHDPY